MSNKPQNKPCSICTYLSLDEQLKDLTRSPRNLRLLQNQRELVFRSIIKKTSLRYLHLCPNSTHKEVAQKLRRLSLPVQKKSPSVIRQYELSIARALLKLRELELRLKNASPSDYEVRKNDLFQAQTTFAQRKRRLSEYLRKPVIPDDLERRLTDSLGVGKAKDEQQANTQVDESVCPLDTPTKTE